MRKDEDALLNLKRPSAQVAARRQPSLDEPQKKPNEVRIKHGTCAQLINDLSYLNDSKNECMRANVHFEFRDARNESNTHETVSLHSLILFARSNWFRRSWRYLNSEESNEKPEAGGANRRLYNLDYKRGHRIDNNDVVIESIDSDISLAGPLPSLPDGDYRFKIICTELETINGKKHIQEYLSAFKQFRRFLYRSECDVNETNAKYMLAFAYVFEADSMNKFLASYFMGLIRKSVEDNNLLRIILILELAHYYDLEDVKKECIKVLLEKRNSIEKLNYALWKKISQKYPELLLEIFYTKTA